MSGGNYYQQNQPQQGGYPPNPTQKPYGHAGQAPQPGQFVPPGNLPEQCFGGFWIRFAAVIIDGLVVGVPLQIVGTVIQIAMGAGMQQTSSANSAAGAGMAMGALGVMMVIYLVVPALYYILMESKKGGTLGKLAVGLRTVDQNGMYPSVGLATGRYFARILSGCILYIGFILAAFDPQKRALHDKICGTFVVRKEFAHPSQLVSR
jgi:uncharacterized RDD family membrane protein YckC